jgi:hypothetical protein
MFPLRREILPHRGVDRSMADDLQAPHEFDALEQRQGWGRRGPVVTREPFVAQNGMHLGKVPEDMWVAFQRCGTFERGERLTVIASRLVRMANGVVGIETGRIGS